MGYFETLSKLITEAGLVEIIESSEGIMGTTSHLIATPKRTAWYGTANGKAIAEIVSESRKGQIEARTPERRALDYTGLRIQLIDLKHIKTVTEIANRLSEDYGVVEILDANGANLRYIETPK